MYILLPHHFPHTDCFPIAHGLDEIHAIGVTGQVDLRGLYVVAVRVRL